VPVACFCSCSELPFPDLAKGFWFTTTPVMGTSRREHEEDDPSAILLGTWCYCAVGKYRITLTEQGHLRFDERHSDGKEVFGILRPAEGSARELPCRNYQADTFGDGEFRGMLRLFIPEDRDTLVSAFKVYGADEWTPNIWAKRVKEEEEEEKEKAEEEEDAQSPRRPAATTPSSAPHSCCWDWAKRSGNSAQVVTRVNDAGASVVHVWELQRRSALFGITWRAPFFPQDKWRLLARWVDRDNRRHPWTAKADELADAAGRPPIAAAEGWRLEDAKWAVVPGAGGPSDGDGWQYALDFAMPDSLWGAEGALRGCRRRLWRCPLVKTQCKKDGLEGTQPAAPATGLELGSEWTLVAQEQVGHMQLGKEAERLVADEWKAGCLAFDLIQLRDLLETPDVGPWQGESGVVKTRVLSLHIKLPPGPMCPESSKATVSYRICVQDPATTPTIVCESSWEMLDVPYGDHFAVVEHISLVPVQDGVVATKAFKLVWFKSSLLQSFIESSTRSSILESGPEFVDAIRRRSQDSDSAGKP